MIINLLQTNPDVAIILILTLVFSLSFHEFSHAYVAYRCGDHTAAQLGRLTLNPIAHLDPIGSLMLLFIGFGYAKPVPVNMMNLHHPRKDMIKVAFAGPASNLILVVIACFVMRILGNAYLFNNETIALTLYLFASINMTLAIFNLLPIYPLDGGQIFGGYIQKISPSFSERLRADGPKVLFAIIIIGLITGHSIIWYLISPFHKLVRIMAGIG